MLNVTESSFENMQLCYFTFTIVVTYNISKNSLSKQIMNETVFNAKWIVNFIIAFNGF